MSTIVKNIHIFKNNKWTPIKRVYDGNTWKKMKGIFFEGEWYEIGITCTVMPDDKPAISTTEHPRWNENDTHYGTNNFGFNTFAGGYRNYYGTFDSIGGSGYWWCNYRNYGWHQGSEGFWGSWSGAQPHFLRRGYSVRCVKDYTGSQPNGTILSNDYTDGDGNTYDSVVIGEQLWTVKNLHTTKYQNGTPIQHKTDNNEWINLTVGAYCWYDNDYNTWGVHYGALYNWYAMDGLVDNNGYRVPSISDWTQLTNYLINTTWCNGITVTSDNVARYLKSCRQVNHPLG